MVIQPLPLQVLLPLKLDRRCSRLLKGVPVRQELMIDGMGGRPHDCRRARRYKPGHVTANPVFVEPGLPGGDAKPLQ